MGAAQAALNHNPGPKSGERKATQMANMSYCKFQNTLGNLRDCLETLKEGNQIDSLDEKSAAESLLRIMADYFEEQSLLTEEITPRTVASKIEDIVDGACTRRVAGND